MDIKEFVYLTMAKINPYIAPGDGVEFELEATPVYDRKKGCWEISLKKQDNGKAQKIKFRAVLQAGHIFHEGKD